MLLEADPVRLAQVLANLLNNAAKYTEPGGKIWLTARPEGREVTISVRDTGAGIPAHVHEDLEQTFVLEGSLVDQEGECTAGNFVIRAKGSRHAPTAPNGCTMLVFFLKPTAALKKTLLKHA